MLSPCPLTPITLLTNLPFTLSLTVTATWVTCYPPGMPGFVPLPTALPTLSTYVSLPSTLNLPVPPFPCAQLCTHDLLSSQHHSAGLSNPLFISPYSLLLPLPMPFQLPFYVQLPCCSLLLLLLQSIYHLGFTVHAPHLSNRSPSLTSSVRACHLNHPAENPCLPFMIFLYQLSLITISFSPTSFSFAHPLPLFPSPLTP